LIWDEGNSRTDIVDVTGASPGPVGAPFVAWPVGFRGVRLAGGEVGVVDPANHLVAITGRRYSLNVSIGGIGGFADYKGPTWVESYVLCSDLGSVIPK